MPEKIINAILFVVGMAVVFYVMYQLGEPRTVWFFNLIGVGQ